jgi:Asp-tRNA(Asn)/Glu-tRNA(Gln) amidotransferase B subunit
VDDLNKLLKKASDAVKRDINHIYQEVSTRKLSDKSARDLVAYVKLLTDLSKAQKEQKEELAAVPDDELKKLAKELLNETQS